MKALELDSGNGKKVLTRKRLQQNQTWEGKASDAPDEK